VFNNELVMKLTITNNLYFILTIMVITPCNKCTLPLIYSIFNFEHTQPASKWYLGFMFVSLFCLFFNVIMDQTLTSAYTAHEYIPSHKACHLCMHLIIENIYIYI